MASLTGKGGFEGNSQISGSVHTYIWWGGSHDLGKLQESLLKVTHTQKAGGNLPEPPYPEIARCSHWLKLSILHGHRWVSYLSEISLIFIAFPLHPMESIA